MIGRRRLLLGATAAMVTGTTGRAEAVPRMTRTGGYEVRPLVDASGPFFTTRQAAFPDATERDWARARRLDPRAFGPDDTWELDFRCFVIRGPRGRLMLVDAGVGPADSPAASWAPVPGRLPAELEQAGIDPAEVDTVVLTHLHSDHFGWAVLPDGTPMFPGARYVVQQREVAALQAGDTALSYIVEPLRGTGQLDQVTGSKKLASGVTVIPTPGHTPGHQSVVVETGHRQVVVTGDVLVHAVQLVAPDVAYTFESDPDAARRTRTRLLREASNNDAVLATAHLRQPFAAAGKVR